jgi:4-nitrophenyl phosphatase
MRFYACYAFDLDGTLYRGNQPIKGAVNTVFELKNRGAKILYVSNNSSLTNYGYVEKLVSLGFPADETWVRSSAIAAGEWLRTQSLKTLFVVGEPGLVQTLTLMGFTVINADTKGNVEPLYPSHFHLHADAVVTGICKTNLSYPLLDSAMQHIKLGAKFVATNGDASFPLEGRRFAPGAGATVAFLEACSGVKPHVTGKPRPEILLEGLKNIGICPEDCLMVGDRNDTDMECGITAGCDTALVQTGVDFRSNTATYIIESVENLLT